MGEEKGKYRIGEDSSLLGISAEGLRFYECSGIIQLVKSEESGCRYYAHLDESALIRGLTYRDYGFSVKETSNLLNTSNVQKVRETYMSRAKEMECEIALRQKRLQYLREIIDVMEGLEDKLRQCKLVESPGMYRFEFIRQHKIFLDTQGKEEFQRWVNMVPFTFLSMRCPSAGEPYLSFSSGGPEKKFSGSFAIIMRLLSKEPGRENFAFPLDRAGDIAYYHSDFPLPAEGKDPRR